MVDMNFENMNNERGSESREICIKIVRINIMKIVNNAKSIWYASLLEPFPYLYELIIYFHLNFLMML